MDGSRSVTIVEVGPRDGFQNIADFIPTGEKVKIVEMLVDAGVTQMEVSSFAHPKWIPQLADAAEVFARIDRKPGVVYGAFVPNERGFERAVECGVKEVLLTMACTEKFNVENLNMPIEDTLALFDRVVRRAKEVGVKVNVGLAGAFGCPYEGDVPVEQVVKLTKAYERMGIDAITIADSIGVANPEQVRTLFATLLDSFPNTKFSLHLHDILGIGLANAYAAYAAGADRFESSVAGLGGCPYAMHPGGNVATEQLVNMFDKMGVATGIDLDKFLEASRYVRSVVGENPAKQQGRPTEAQV